MDCPHARVLGWMREGEGHGWVRNDGGGCAGADMAPLVPAHIPQRGEGQSCGVAPSVVWLPEPLTGGLLHDGDGKNENLEERAD
jgi:hypothetical protein